MKKQVDVAVENRGTIWRFWALSKKAQAWVAKHVQMLQQPCVYLVYDGLDIRSKAMIPQELANPRSSQCTPLWVRNDPGLTKSKKQVVE